MHVADPARGVLGANAIVGASLPLAVGAALSSKLLGQGRVAVAFFGEGAVNQGAFHEAVNLAAIWDLPALLVCENNIYAEFTDSRTMTRVPRGRRARRAPTASRPRWSTATTSTRSTRLARAAAARCRAGDGPFLIEAETYRWHGHYEGDAQPYKPEDESADWRERDPLVVSRRAARRARRGDRRASSTRSRARPRARVDAAIERARALAATRARGGLRGCLRRLRRQRRRRATSTPSARAWRGARGGRARRPDRHRRRRGRRHLHGHQGPARALRRRAGASTRRSARWATSAPRSAPR